MYGYILKTNEERIPNKHLQALKLCLGSQKLHYTSGSDIIPVGAELIVAGGSSGTRGLGSSSTRASSSLGIVGAKITRNIKVDSNGF
jgi:hypothetical protein